MIPNGKEDPLRGRDGDLLDRAARLERQLAAAQQITHIGSWEWDVATNSVVWSDELYRIYGLEPGSCEITFESFLSRVHPEDRDNTARRVSAALEAGGTFGFTERILRPDGSLRVLESKGEVLRDDHGRAVALIGTCRDVTEHARLTAIGAAEQRILEMIASGESLPDVLTRIVQHIEQQSPGTLGSILLHDDGKVRHGAAPSLPDEYNRAIEGAPIGPRAGSCGTAMYRKEPVYVTDIETDPLWDDYRALIQQHDLRACWSTPVLDKEGDVLGSFALYYRQPRSPTDSDLNLIARATRITRIAIERHLLEDQLRALSAHVESVREDERTGIAREIHDELGQSLTALKLDMAWLGRRAAKPGGVASAVVLERVKAMAHMTDGIIDQVRHISAELRPGILDDLGLTAAIEWQSRAFQERTGTLCDVTSTLGDERLDDKLATAVFRVFQEALTNVARHAAAERVNVRLERTDGWLELHVDDDGLGIPPASARSPKSLGLLGMRERARRLGGSITVRPRPDQGTALAMSVPLSSSGGAR